MRVLFSQPKHFNGEMMSFISQNLGSNSIILTLYYCQAFYIDRRITTDYNLENKFVYHEQSVDLLLIKLKRIGITHVYLSDNDYSTREVLWQKNFSETLILSKEFKDTHLKEVYSSGDQHLFRIIYTTQH